jgi:hypothetical protein
VTPELAALATVIDLLNQLGIPYMVTGSVAASAHGRPRSTHDADIVIDPTRAQLDHLVDDLDDRGFYVSADAARSALSQRGQFNVIETAHACKIDLIIRKTRPFSVEEFSRRVPMDLPVGRDINVVTAEDSILSKLEWSKMSSGSTRQLDDAAAIVAVAANLDRPYIEHWAAQIGVLELWRQIAGS